MASYISDDVFVFHKTLSLIHVITDLGAIKSISMILCPFDFISAHILNFLTKEAQN